MAVVQWVILAAAVVVAAGVLWNKALHPAIKGVVMAEEMVPLLREVSDVFKDNPSAFTVLAEIAAQFRTDSGSSLRDVVNRLEDASKVAVVAGDVLKLNAEVSKQLAEQDRRQLERLVVLLDRLDVKVSDASEVTHRIELDRASVASDLAASQARADDVEDGEPGAAADAAAGSVIEEG